jgi:phosphate-selective porin OprO/OprP
MRGAFISAVLVAACAAPAAAQQTVPPDTDVDISTGALTISSGVNSLTIGARAQFRWTAEDREQFDADTAGGGVGEVDGLVSQFDIPRMRVTLAGGVYRPWMRYSFQFEFTRTGGEGASKIKDAFLEIRPTGRTYRFTMGQFKVPFGLQQLTSSSRLQFVDRAITDSKFVPSREMGVTVSGTTAATRVGYAGGVFNGSGESAGQNNRSHLWAARVFVHPYGAYSLAEGAVDAGDRMVLHLGAGAHGGDPVRGRSTAGVIEDADGQTAFNVEFALTAPRFHSTAEYFWMSDEQRNPAAGADIDSRGYHAQAGYMVVPRRAEVGIRYAEINPNTDLDDVKLNELRGVFGYFWQGHNLKLQADIGGVGYEERFAALSSRARQGLPALGPRLVAGQDLFDTQMRVQFQLAF